MAARIRVVRAIDGVTMFEMTFARSDEDVAAGLLTYDDALEIATDIVTNARRLV
jgi:hypothetical protein